MMAKKDRTDTTKLSNKLTNTLVKRSAKSVSSGRAPYFLEHIKVTSFGKFANTIVGPFKPGMNVVYGPNEAGKTTLNELVKGVLFGWPQARGETNSYRPEHMERAGSLFFHNTVTDEVVELKRVKNSDDVTASAPLLNTIDRETYETMFSLTSDELLRLDRHSDITARLLTAGSGTSASPAHARSILEKRIKELTSRSAQVPDSIANLKSRQSELRDVVRAGREEADKLRDQERVLASLSPRSHTLQATQNRLNGEIEELQQASTHLRALDTRIDTLTNDLDGVLHSTEDPNGGAGASPVPDDDIAALVDLSQADEYRLHDQLDTFDERRAKLEHMVDNARSAAHASRAEYELYTEDDQKQKEYARARMQRWIIMAVAIVVPLIMALIGVYVLVAAGRLAGSSYRMPGVLLIAFAVCLFAVGMLIARKPSRVEEEWGDERKKKEWVMQQDRKTLEACEQDARDYDAQIEAYLNNNGLAAAEGSPRRARRLLDKARDFRSSYELALQTRQSLAARKAALIKELTHVRAQRKELCQKLGVDEVDPQTEITHIVKRKTDERTKTQTLIADTQRQIGEITERLTLARRGVSFDEAKLESEAVETRLQEQYRELALLLVAKQSLDAAISDWERKSQPEVYRCASRLLSQMTGGAWCGVRMNPAGDIEVMDAIKTVRPPYLLSLGTRQQLYLSLRIALLLTAENVGRGLPIMCDDILVNFDNERREQAVSALVELASKRQVILFTCHPDVASLVCASDPNCNLIEL